MAVPNLNHPNWPKLVAGDIAPELEFLGLKVLLMRLNLRHRLKPGPETLQACLADLKAFFEKNGQNPKVLNDIQKVMG